MQENLIKTLNEITNILKQKNFYRYINYGGCGYFSYLIILQLKHINAILKENKIKFSIKTVLEFGEINHVFLEFPDFCFYYDSEGITKSIEIFLSYGYETSKITFNNLRNKNIEDNWNKKFPRESLPIIKKVIESAFTKNFNLQNVTIN